LIDFALEEIISPLNQIPPTPNIANSECDSKRENTFENLEDNSKNSKSDSKNSETDSENPNMDDNK
jgi:hypothetical protein